jgi:hypothetical protein
LAWQDRAWLGVARLSAARYGMVFLNSVMRSFKKKNLIWRGTAGLGRAGCGVVRCGKVWFF